MNTPAAFAAPDRLGYAGFIGCEDVPRGRTEDGLVRGRSFGVGSATA